MLTGGDSISVYSTGGVIYIAIDTTTAATEAVITDHKGAALHTIALAAGLGSAAGDLDDETVYYVKLS